MSSKRIIRTVVLTALVLLLPLLAMLFTDEVDWGPADFAVAGALLLGAGLAYEFGGSRRGGRVYRAAAGLAVATSLLLVWANLAVGIIGSENNPANLAFFGVVAFAIAGSAFARLRPSGMCRAMFATAIAQAIAATIATAISWHSSPAAAPLGIVEVIAVNLMFVLLFVGAGLLFRRAAAAESSR